MWADNIAKRDYLGFEVHTRLIKGLIDEPEMLPITIGVFGDWGSGKSSIMEALKKAYDDEKDKTTLCLQFNGWVFEGYDDAKVALIGAILKAFEDNKTIPQQAQEKVAKLLKSINWMRVIGFGVKNIAAPLVTASLTSGVSLIPQLYEWVKGFSEDPQKIAGVIKGLDYDEFKKKFLEASDDPDMKANYQAVREFREDFKELLEASNVKKLIVLIDDLDRCLPDRIIDNLEAIKLFLNVENTAFIIGADPRIVRDAIRHRYKGLIERDSEDENKRVVVDYLEKLIQVPYTLPKLSDTEVETYITLLFCEELLGKDNMDKVISGFRAFRQTDRYSVFGVDKVKEVITDSKLQTQLDEKVSLISKLSPLISRNLNGNPRQIKRFLNTFILRKQLADAAQLVDFKDDVLAKLMILEYAEPNLFSELYSWQVGNKGYALPLKSMEVLDKDGNVTLGEQFSKWKSAVAWLQSEPFLSDVDLRDYFWLSRDSLESMSNVMTPPSVKQVLSSLMTKGQAEKLIHNKIREDVLCLPENLQHELYSQLEKHAIANEDERKQIFNLFEYLIDDGCACEQEFRSLCKQVGFKKKPSLKEIVGRIVEAHQEYKDLM